MAMSGINPQGCTTPIGRKKNAPCVFSISTVESAAICIGCSDFSNAVARLTCGKDAGASAANAEALASAPVMDRAMNSFFNMADLSLGCRGGNACVVKRTRIQTPRIRLGYLFFVLKPEKFRVSTEFSPGRKFCRSCLRIDIFNARSSLFLCRDRIIPAFRFV